MPNFHPRSKDMGSALIAEQNLNILEEVETLKKDIKGSLAEFTDVMATCMESLRDGIIESTRNDMKRALCESNAIAKHDSEAMLKTITDKCSKLENVVERLIKKDDFQPASPKAFKETENAQKTANAEVGQSIPVKHKVVWVGTSLSKALDTKKFAKDLGVDLEMAKAYCVESEGKFPQSSFKAIVPKVAKGANTIGLQTGSIEITNLDVNNSVVNPDKDIEVSKKEWFDKVEAASSSLFKIAEECVAADPELNVVIVKRPQRFDRSSGDILGIKSKLSEFGNRSYDQLLLKSNHSDRIHLVELNLLNNSNSNYLKSIIYGTPDNPKYDGIHMIAGGATRHFTYRALQSIGPILHKM